MRSTSIGLVFASLVLVGSTASAGEIVTFDASRTYSQFGYYLTGSAMTGPYNQLLAAGHTVTEINLITPQSLANAVVFVTGLMDVNTTLAPSELAALQAFVAGGGGLLYMGENAAWAATNMQFAAGFNGPAWGGAVSGSTACSPVTIGHPMITGPAGVVGPITGAAAAGYWVSGAAHTQIMDYADTTDAVVAFTYGQGNVAFFGDVAFFGNPSAYGPSNVILWDNTIAWLVGNCTTSMSNYCTAGTTSHGCLPSISGNGTASASAGSGFSIDVIGVEGQKTGLIFYGVDNTGFTPLAWGVGGSSFLCVKAPTQRTAVQVSGGTFGACDGTLSIDWNAFIAANPGALGAPFAGNETVFAQAWFRDPAAVKTTNLSDGLQFHVCP